MYSRQTDRIVRMWETGNLDKAGYGHLKAHTTATNIVYQAIDYVSKQTLQGPALITELKRMLDSYQRSLSSLLGTLELIGSLAPLLGLLGTVIGMIEAFQAMQAAGVNVDPSVLSGGIWKALLTTAIGLAVAIPAIIIHNWLGRRVDNHVADVGDRVTRVLTTANTYPVDEYHDYRER
jgi:biopolymer transport protein ExbB